ncbi:MAG: BrnT family toxin [Agrobacterium albertimagni]|uniref:BrnT family toxin n=1 Tax=Agrobacterium albertimagni AOL15 TaxID=1156935 RepID=K2QCN9_9HYPH|nr:BrnT family toxin [Agrobacterium albertimagni]EKF58766.1 hypothetical protein QWE_14407 [Agrobacterium albertimagni AOL15]
MVRSGEEPDQYGETWCFAGIWRSYFDDLNHLVVPSIRERDGEDRYNVIGRVEEKLFTGVFVWRGQEPRFISVRRSNQGEERAYRDTG